MPKLAEKEARGTTETVEDCYARHCLACSVYASVAAVLGKMCVALLPLSIIASSLRRGKSRNLVPCRMAG